jgi:hypothetical protein
MTSEVPIKREKKKRKKKPKKQKMFGKKEVNGCGIYIMDFLF